MRNFLKPPGHGVQPWGQGVVVDYPAQPHAHLMVSPEGVSLGMVQYTGSEDGQWMGRSGKASFRSTQEPHRLKRAGRT